MRAGFTILELLIILTVMSFLAAAGVRTYFLRPDVTLENAAVLLADDLRTTQNRSAYLGEESHFRFLPDGDGYEVTTRDGSVVDNPRTQSVFERRYSADGVFAGVHITAIELGQTNEVLVFDEQGQACSALRVTLAFGTARRKVLVSAGSGRVAIEGSSSGWIDDGF